MKRYAFLLIIMLAVVIVLVSAGKDEVLSHKGDLKVLANTSSAQVGLKILEWEIPILSEAGENKKIREKKTKKIIKEAVYRFTRVEVDKPHTYLQAEIPIMAEVNYKAIERLNNKKVDEKEPEEKNEDINGLEENKNLPPVNMVPVPAGEPLVALYNTHTSETYAATDGVDHLKGKHGAVARVAEEIQKGLEVKYGIKTIRSDKIHDLPPFGQAYGRSIETARELVKKNPSLLALIDVHRDSLLPRERTVVKINNEEVAKVLLVIGTDHPNWQKNHEFAMKVKEKMDALYPGLSRGVTLKPRRYNQQLHPGALIVEVGGTKNTTEEALRSAKLLVDVFAAVISDIQKSKAQ